MKRETGRDRTGVRRESDTETKTKAKRGQNIVRRQSYRAAKWLKKKSRRPTKRTSEREFKVSIKKLVHLHSENNYKWPASPCQALSPPPHPFISVRLRTRERVI